MDEDAAGPQDDALEPRLDQGSILEVSIIRV
jgi:hypothetical protein